MIIWLIKSAQEGPTLLFSTFIRLQKARQSYKLSWTELYFWAYITHKTEARLLRIKINTNYILPTTNIQIVKDYFNLSKQYLASRNITWQNEKKYQYAPYKNGMAVFEIIKSVMQNTIINATLCAFWMANAFLIKVCYHKDRETGTYGIRRMFQSTKNP